MADTTQNTPASGPALVISVDKAAFLASVQKYINTSPLIDQFNQIRYLKWPDALVPPQLGTTVTDLTTLVSATCAAVELAKVDIIKEHDPDGSKGAKFDNQIALATAVEVLGSLISFKGWLGTIINSLAGPIFNLLISMYVEQQPSDWVKLALEILAFIPK